MTTRGEQRRARLREIARIFREERLLDLFRGAGLEEYVAGEVPDENANAVEEKRLPVPVRLRHALERLGPVFVKMGQYAATRADLCRRRFSTSSRCCRTMFPPCRGWRCAPRSKRSWAEP